MLLYLIMADIIILFILHQKLSFQEITNLKKNIKSKDDQIQKLRQKKIEKDFALESGRSLPIIHSHGLDPSCHVCGKTFLNIVYLQAHLQRRHRDEQPERDSGPVVHQNQVCYTSDLLFFI